MINSQSKSLGLKDSSLTKTEAKTQNSLNNTNDFDYRLKVRHVVEIYIYISIYLYLYLYLYLYIYIYIYIYIDIVPDVPDTSSESKSNIGAAFGCPKNRSHQWSERSHLRSDLITRWIASLAFWSIIIFISIFNVEHALSCPTGGYPIIHHNEVRDLTASFLQQVCHDVAVEPHLQPLTGEKMDLRSANCEDAARLDVSARGVWGGRFERSFFDIRVFNPCA